MRWRPCTACVVLAALPLGGCAGIQSALQPMGREAAEIYRLLLTVTAVSVVITLLVLGLIAVVLWGPQRWRDRIAAHWVILGGGIVLPVVVLSVLLAYGLAVLEAGTTRPAHGNGPAIIIVGKRWWWQVTYVTADGRRIESANELRLPVGRPVRLLLESDNVIHSFWAPTLAGKLDMIPGRTNRITVEAQEAGVSRGQCAEYCGGPHALMAFSVVAMPADAYDAWLDSEARPAQQPESEQALRGRALFLANGCGGCHTVRGTTANGVIGPDLTHVGARRSLGAGTLPNDAEAFARWIRHNQTIKPDNLMPAYAYLAQEELAAVATYLEGLD